MLEKNGNWAAEPAPQPVRRIPLSSVALGALLGTVGGLVIVLVAAVFLLREDMPPVTDESLEAAVARWNEHGPDSYELDVILSGSQSGEIHIEVRDGEVIAMTRDGVTPSQRRTWDYWSVPNQFEMIRQDLESAKNPRQAFGVSGSSQVVMRADFDPELGYPRTYRRTILGTRSDIRWDIVRFRALE